MKKLDIKNYEKMLKDDNDDSLELKNAVQKIDQKIVNAGFIKAIFVFIILIFAFLLKDMVSKLSFVNSIYYIMFLIIGLILLIGLVSYMLLKKTKNATKKTLKRHLKIYFWYDLGTFFLLTISIIYFIFMFVFTPAKVEKSSMNNTYFDGDRVLVWHLAYTPKVGDAVVINVIDDYINPAYQQMLNDTEFLIKRVIAKGKDVLTYSEGNLYVNNKLTQSVTLSQFQNLLTTYDKGVAKKYYTNNTGTIPDNYYLVMGDNRSNSLDSREIGLIPKKQIIGVCFIRLYPFARFGIPKKDVIS